MFPARNAGHVGFGIQQRRHATAQFGRFLQEPSFVGQRNPRPIAPNAVGVLGQVRRAVADGQGVHPDGFRLFVAGVRSFDLQSRQIFACRLRQIGDRHVFRLFAQQRKERLFAFLVQTVAVAKPQRHGNGVAATRSGRQLGKTKKQMAALLGIWMP